MVRRGRAARLGELLTRNATLEALADQAPQLSLIDGAGTTPA